MPASNGRRVAIALAVLLAGLALVLWIRASPQPTFLPTRDIAVIEVYTHLAEHGRALVGPYSRFGWNHPGPLYFYLLAPWYALGAERTSAIFAGAAALNAGAICIAIWFVAASARRTFTLAFAAAIALYTWQAAASLATSWNPHVLGLPLMACIVVAAAVMSGRLQLLAWLVATGSFLIQTHLGTAPVVLAVAGAALAGGLLARPDRGWLRPLVIATTTGVVLWLPPILEQLRHSPGNLTVIWRYFTEHSGAEHSFRDAFALWGDLFSAVLRPGFVVPWGAHLPIHGGPEAAIISLVIVAFVAVGTWQATRDRDAFQRSLGLLLLVGIGVSFWSTAHVNGDLMHYVVFWIVALGAICAGYAAECFVSALGARIGGGRSVAMVTAAIAVVALVPVWREAANALANPHRRMDDGLMTLRLADELSDYIRANPGLGKPLLRMDNESWYIAAGILLRLQKTGVPVSVERRQVVMFTDASAPDGTEAWTVTVATNQLRDQILALGQRSIADRDGFFVFVDPTRPPAEPR